MLRTGRICSSWIIFSLQAYFHHCWYILDIQVSNVFITWTEIYRVCHWVVLLISAFNATPASTGTSLFGQQQQQQNNTLFGQSKSLFGASTSTGTSGFSGFGTTTSTQSLFGQQNQQTKVQIGFKNIFNEKFIISCNIVEKSTIYKSDIHSVSWQFSWFWILILNLIHCIHIANNNEKGYSVQCHGSGKVFFPQLILLIWSKYG